MHFHTTAGNFHTTSLTSLQLLNNPNAVATTMEMFTKMSKSFKYADCVRLNVNSNAFHVKLLPELRLCALAQKAKMTMECFAKLSDTRLNVASAVNKIKHLIIQKKLTF